MTRAFLLATAFLALLPCERTLYASTLRACEVTSPTNTDWIALAKAMNEATAGQTPAFVWDDYPSVSYARIRRSIWLAALHGIREHVCSNAHTRLLMGNELRKVRARLETPFAFDVGVRDEPNVERLYSLLMDAQISTMLLATNSNENLPTVLQCRGEEVLSERTGCVFTSLSMAASFMQSCHAEQGLVFEKDGRIAKGIFIRRFTDGSASVVNMTDKPRRDLFFRKGLTRSPFDLQPAGVVHLQWRDALPRFSREWNAPFVSGLWKVNCGDGFPQRLVDPSNLPITVSETHRGTVRYATTVFVPKGGASLILSLDADEAETEVTIGGYRLGTRIWKPFEWEIPDKCRGRNVPLEIRIEKQSVNGFLQNVPVWRLKETWR